MSDLVFIIVFWLIAVICLLILFAGYVGIDYLARLL